MISIAAHGHGDRADFIDVVRGCIRLQSCLVQAMPFDACPLLQLPNVMEVDAKTAAKAPSLRKIVESGGEPSMLKPLGNFNAEQVLDIQAFCRHAPLVEASCSIEVKDEPEMAEGDMATLTVTLTRTNLAEDETCGAVHAPLFPGAKFEEWWVIIYDSKHRRMIAADVILDKGRTISTNVTFIVPRHGDFNWKMYALCDSYAGLDVECDIEFSAKRKSEVDRNVFVHPEDMQIKTFFEELMEMAQEGDDDSSEDEEEDDARQTQQLKREQKEEAKVVAVQKEAEPKKAPSSDDEADEEANAIPEGVFYQIMDPTGAFLFKEPREEKEVRLGSVPVSAVVRGFEGDGRPDDWIELPHGNGVWVRVRNATVKTDDDATGSVTQAKRLGPLLEQSLRHLVKAHTPPILMRKWMRHSKRELDVDDIITVQEMDVVRVRLLMEDLAFRRVGNDAFQKLLDQAEEKRAEFKTRISKARGFFHSGNGILWHVTPDGSVKGLHMDGSRIRDNVQVTPDNRISLGPFLLDETRKCSCIHWNRKDDPEKSWTWTRDSSLRTRVRLYTGEPA